MVRKWTFRTSEVLDHWTLNKRRSLLPGVPLLVPPTRNHRSSEIEGKTPDFGHSLDRYRTSHAFRVRLIHKLRRLRSELSYVERNYDLIRSITPRERQIISLVAKGLSNPEIADLLFISRSTVEQHRKNINRKLSMHSTAELVAFAHIADLY